MIGEGSVESIASLSADHVQKAGRPFRIAIDEAGWRFHNLDDHKIAEIRKQEPRANPKEKAIFHRVISLLQLHVEVIFIFDGPKRPWEHGRPSGQYDTPLHANHLDFNLRVQSADTSTRHRRVQARAHCTTVQNPRRTQSSPPPSTRRSRG